MKRNGHTTWEIEEEIGKVVKAAFTSHGYGDDVSFEIRQETREYYQVLINQDGEIGGVGEIDFGVLEEINKEIEITAIQPELRDCFCIEVRIEAVSDRSERALAELKSIIG